MGRRHGRKQLHQKDSQDKELEVPLYQHDCPSCRFLGRWSIYGWNYDLYFCPNHNGEKKMVVARYGPSSLDVVYGWKLPLAIMDAPEPAPYTAALVEAMKRAAQKEDQ